MEKQEIMSALKGGLIVSCQALYDEPLYGSDIMAAMATAALQGGAVGIRANTPQDIRRIRRVTSAPIIGILKRTYEDSQVYITPTFREVEELSDTGADIIALDATDRRRPGGVDLRSLVAQTRLLFPSMLLMADCSTLEDGFRAAECGFDFISTTLCGYTDQTMGTALPNCDLVEGLSRQCKVPVIAEGGIWTPEQLISVMDHGAFAAVIGTAITRPQAITKKFTSALNNVKN